MTHSKAIEPGMYRRSDNLYLHAQRKGDRIYEYWAFRYWDGFKIRHFSLGSTKKVNFTAAKNKALQLRNELLIKRTARDLEKMKIILGTSHNQVAPPVEVFDDLKPNSPLFDDAIKIFLDLKMNDVGAKSLNDWTTSLHTFSPKLGKKRVATITAEHIEAVLKPIWHKKTYMSHRSLSRLAKFFSWATARGYYEGNNPANWKDNFEHRLPNPTKLVKTQSYPALPWMQTHDFYKDLDQRDSIGSIALRLIVLTGQRSGQIRKAKWRDIDFEKRTWVFPANNMKGGIPHVISIDEHVINVIHSIPKTGREELFNPTGNGPMVDVSVSKVIIDMNKNRQASGLPTWHDPSDGRSVNPHGFRTTLRMWGADKEHNRQAMEFQLAHKIKDKVEAAYQRSNLLEVRRKIMQEWSNFVVNGANGGDSLIE